MKQSKYTSTGWIIFFFIIFWPIGVYLLIKRSNEKQSVKLADSGLERNIAAKYESKKNISLACALLFGASAVSAIGTTTITGAFSGLMAIVSAFPVGIVALVCYKSYKKKKDNLELYSEYINYFSAIDYGEISVLAMEMGKDEYDVRQDLGAINHLGIFGVTVDGDIAYLSNSADPAQPAARPTINKKVTKTVTCQACGAPCDYVVGENNKCPYCGSALE